MPNQAPRGNRPEGHRVKLVSDFDGVWTDPEAEAAAQGEIIERTLAAWAPEDIRDAVPGWIAAARAAVLRDPTSYGWAPGGRLSAFGDEDPFTAHTALLHRLYLEAPRDPVAEALRDAIAAHGLGLDSFAGKCHAEGVARAVAARGPGILESAARAGHALLARGVEIVVVSNSDDAKLTAWFAHAGLPHAVHPAGGPGVTVRRQEPTGLRQEPTGRKGIRLRGASRKFELDPDRSERLALGEVRIETARPAYERILREERPDAVVGDVFSLDLALPLALRRRDPAWSRVRLFWLLQPYTPAWLRALVERHAGAEVELVKGGFAGLAELLGASVPAR